MALTRELGSTGIEVTRLCAGAAAWCSPSHPHGGVDAAESAALADALFRSEVVRYLDTSNNYGSGESERRIGSALRVAGGVPAGFVLQTKADRDMVTGDFSGSRMRVSIEREPGPPRPHSPAHRLPPRSREHLVGAGHGSPTVRSRLSSPPAPKA